jgi:hypothetical protein
VKIALAADDVAALDEAFPAGAAAGERYAPAACAGSICERWWKVA